MGLSVSDPNRAPASVALDPRPYLERWARWREADARYSRVAIGPLTGGLLGALRDGRGSTICPTCKGAKRMPGKLVRSKQEFLNVPCPDCGGAGTVDADLETVDRQRLVPCPFCRNPATGRSSGEIDGRTCHKCKGGKQLQVRLEVHPATIKGTRHLGQDIETDPVSAHLNRVIFEWAERNETYWFYRVALAEYARNGTQEMKAAQMGVSRGWYLKNLCALHRRVVAVVDKFLFHY